MNPNYQYTKNYVLINIHKPVYGSFVYIRDKHIQYAKKHKIPLKITIPQGTFIRTPQDWMENAQRHEQVFKDPEHPMVLFGNHVIHGQKKYEEVKDETGRVVAYR